MLFATLATCPHLAKHVRRLSEYVVPQWNFITIDPSLCGSEIRDFPKVAHWARSPETTRILEHTITGLGNCTNLRSCTWTRDGSITDEILNALASLPNLCDLELNGHDSMYYHHKFLRQFTQLQRISVIMPSLDVVLSVRDMVFDSGDKLKSLTMTCKVRPLLSTCAQVD